MGYRLLPRGTIEVMDRESRYGNYRYWRPYWRYRRWNRYPTQRVYVQHTDSLGTFLCGAGFVVVIVGLLRLIQQ